MKQRENTVQKGGDFGMSENIQLNPIIIRKEDNSIGIYDPARVNIFQQAAAEIGLGVLVRPTNKTRWVSSDKPKEPAIELMSLGKKDLSQFWKKVIELEAAVAKKVG